MFRRSTNNPWIPPGGINSGSFLQIGGEDVAPGVGARFPGQIGQTVVHSNKTALQDSFKSPITGLTVPLFEGVYQLVKWAPGVTTPARGSLVFWNTLALNGVPNFEVTTVASSVGNFRAGVCLFTETVAAAGKFTYIQVAGLASILFGAAPSANPGQLIIQATAANTPLLTAVTVNTFADGQAIPADGANLLKAIVGRGYETTNTASVTNRVLMDLNGFVPNIG
jgi:hypothetical protein